MHPYQFLMPVAASRQSAADIVVSPPDNWPRSDETRLQGRIDKGGTE